jgi:hypothetical protein
MPESEGFPYDDLAPGPDSNYPGSWIGAGSLQSAIEEAWRQARDRGSPTTLRIVSISIRGSNPVREYKIDCD